MSTPDAARPGPASGAGTNWERVERLFHDAIELPAEQRRAFLTQACGGDSALQRDVESLLAQKDGPLLRDGVQALARQMTRGSREGTRLGPYVLGPLIGEGGMGEVYRARDSRLDREVAIKLLPPELASDPDRLWRSEREARVLASLNHQNIATLFGVEESDGLTGLVLELVPGRTLQQHLTDRGPLPLDETLRIARQVANALEAAHQHGIVHRDLKPANITITPDGVVKVLDFGLARVEISRPDGETISAGLTATGRILGTPAYMSPEQARGTATDRRTDIWAFGCVLFEMLTGERVFQGDSAADTVAAIIHRDPPLDRLPPSTPWHVRATIDRCLQKDARDRARDISDVRMALDGAFGGADVAAPATRPKLTIRWLAAAAVAGALLSGALVWMLRTPPPAVAPVMRFRVSAPDGLRFGRVALSPDGRSLAFTDAAEGRSGLWVHSFETGESRHLERAGQFTTSMFWSPDSTFIGFNARNAIHRIAVDGSPPSPITTVERYGGAQWTADGTILYGQTQGTMMKVPASGGPPVAVTELDRARDEIGHTNPAMLPDGRRFLYVRVSRNPQQSGVFVGSLDTAPGSQSTTPLLPFRTTPLISRSPDGAVHVLFVRDGTLLAQRLDLASMTLSEPASVIVEEVGAGLGGVPVVSAAGGTIAFRPPETARGGAPAWYDRNGHRLGPVFTKAVTRLVLPQLSPDGTRLAAIVGSHLWVYPLDGRPPIRLTSDGSLSPLWTPDGQSIVYERFGPVNGLHIVAADGSRSVPRAVGPPGHLHAVGFLPERRGVLAAMESSESPESWSLVEVPWSGSDAPVRVGDIVQRTPDAGGALSPDGRWLAHIANTTGTAELWVRRYPTLDAAVRISPNGGTEPVWSKDGRELFYFEGERLMRVRVGAETNGRLSFAPPMAIVVEQPFVRAGQPPSFDVTSDGRLLLLEQLPAPPPAPIDVIVNWAHAAKRISQ